MKDSMLSRIDFLTGLFLGLVVCLYVCIVGYGYFWAIVWLKEWQTLLTGLLATIAAVSTVIAIRQQILQAEILARDASLRRNWAARAVIAAPLSKLCAVESELRAKLFKEIVGLTVASKFEGEIKWQNLSDREVDLLARCIEDAEPQAAADLSALLSELQIQQSRLDSMVSDRRNDSFIVTRHNLLDLALDSIFVSARAQRLFHYSRRQEAEYFAKPLSKPVFEQHWQELEEFQLQATAESQLGKADDKWLAPISQRTPQSW